MNIGRDVLPRAAAVPVRKAADGTRIERTKKNTIKTLHNLKTGEKQKIMVTSVWVCIPGNFQPAPLLFRVVHSGVASGIERKHKENLDNLGGFKR
jgi:hypothetical protein